MVTVVEDLGLVQVACPECATPRDLDIGPGCAVCEGEGTVLMPASVVGTSQATPTQDIEGNAREDAPDAQESAEGDAEQVRDTSKSWGGMSPSEAASLRWKQERARQAEQESVTAGEDIVVRTTVPVSTIIKRLSKDAQGGSHQAARELRAWLSDVVVETSTSLSELDERTRQAMVARLLSEIEEEGQAGGEGGATPAVDGTPGSRELEAPLAAEQAESPRISDAAPVS